jgi:ornithine carbamoyltransferase
MDLTVCCPEGFEPDAEVLKYAQETIAQFNGTIEIDHNPQTAVKGANVIYTDVWASMGQEDEHAERVKKFMPYQVNQQLMDAAAPNCQVLHCLPAHRGEEITDEVLDGENSIVFQQAENRLHAQKGIMALIM